VRFDEDLQVTTSISDQVIDRTVPAFSLQLLVENAIKHGLRTSNMPVRVQIAARLTDTGALLLEVANSGSLRQEAKSSGKSDPGVGLANLRERLLHLFPNAHGFDLGEQDGWVRAKLWLAQAKTTAA
jgi:LytS/YehU family sensor histidine kinase